jgi:hypothetical protein
VPLFHAAIRPTDNTEPTFPTLDWIDKHMRLIPKTMDSAHSSLRLDGEISLLVLGLDAIS